MWAAQGANAAAPRLRNGGRHQEAGATPWPRPQGLPFFSPTFFSPAVLLARAIGPRLLAAGVMGRSSGRWSRWSR